MEGAENENMDSEGCQVEDSPTPPATSHAGHPDPRERELPEAILELPYVPDFLLADVRFWFVPSKESAKEVYHELTEKAADDWSTYYTKKGWNFLQTEKPQREGPYEVAAGGLKLRILESKLLFSPKPQLRFSEGGSPLPITSLEKRRPLNPWKPNYLKSLNFIKKYDWPHPMPRAVQYAIWEIEECGELAGSTSWKNAVELLKDNDSEELRKTLSDLFFNRPEDYPLGSEVYLRVLGGSGSEGFSELCELAQHPVSRKRKVVATILGELQNSQGLETLLTLLEDEDPEVRRQALRSIGKLGVTPQGDPDGKVAAYMDSEELPERVWAAQAIVRGGDTSHQKLLVTLVKEEPRLMTDMGELGEVIADLGLEDAVPYMIQRLKHEKAEFRADAAEALEKVTGLVLDYQSIDTEEQRRHALRACTRWWEDRKEERRRARKKSS